MGNTTLQKRIFTAMMCFGMVLGMTIYNIILHDGLTVHLFGQLAKELWLVFIVAFILDMFFVGPLAKKFIFSKVTPETKRIFIILGISCTMVCSMVLLMSVFGSIFSKGFTMDAVKIYPKTVGLNFIVALPLNLIIVSPVMRAIFIKIFPEVA